MKAYLYLLTISLISYCFAAPVNPQSGLVEHAVTSSASSIDDDALYTPLNANDVVWLKDAIFTLGNDFVSTYLGQNLILDPQYQQRMDVLEKFFLRPDVQRLMEIVKKPNSHVDVFLYENAKWCAQAQLHFIIIQNLLPVKKFFSSLVRHVTTQEIINHIYVANAAQTLLDLFESNTMALEQLYKDWEALGQNSFPPIEELMRFMKRGAVFLLFSNFKTKPPWLEADSKDQGKANPTVSDPDPVDFGRSSKRQKLTRDGDPPIKVDFGLQLHKNLESCKSLIRKQFAGWPVANLYTPEKDIENFMISIKDAMKSHLQLIRSDDFLGEYLNRYNIALKAMSRFHIYAPMRPYLRCIHPYGLLETILQSYQSIFDTMNKIRLILVKRLKDSTHDDVTNKQREFGRYGYWKVKLQYQHKQMKLLCKFQKEFAKLGRKPSVDSLMSFIQGSRKDVAMMEICLTLLEESPRDVRKVIQNYAQQLQRKNKVSVEYMQQLCKDAGNILDLHLQCTTGNLSELFREYKGGADIMSNPHCDGLYPSDDELDKVFGVMREISEHGQNLMSIDQHMDSTNPSSEMRDSFGTMNTGSTSGSSGVTSESLNR